MKTCTCCGKLKPLAEFHARSNRPSGHTPHCRQCKAAAAAAYRQRNKAACRARSLAWHHANRDRSIANSMRWQAANPGFRSK